MPYLGPNIGPSKLNIPKVPDIYIHILMQTFISDHKATQYLEAVN